MLMKYVDFLYIFHIYHKAVNKILFGIDFKAKQLTYERMEDK